MNYSAKALFIKKTATVILLLCIIPQIVCVGLRFIVTYNSTIGLDLGVITDVLSVAATVIGLFVQFVSFAVILYPVFIFGAGKNYGLLTFVSYAFFGLAFFLSAYIESYIFGAIAMTASAVLCIAVLIINAREFKGIAAFCTLASFITYAFGIVIVLLTDDMTSSEFLYNVMYGMMNFSIEIAVILAVICIAAYFRWKSIRKDKSITIGGHYLPNKSPVLSCCLAVCTLYSFITFCGNITDTVADLADYGMPVNATEWTETLTPYIKLIAIFVIGYFVTAFIVNRIEDSYFEAVGISDRINELMRKGKKHDLG